MIKYRKFSTFFPFLCLVCILVGCERANSDQITPTIHSTPPKEIQISPTPEEQLDDFQTRSKDGMQLIHIPGGSYQMGSTDSEIEDGIELCQEHYQICNRWYYEREDPAHAVSLDPFWIDQTEVSNDQYSLCVSAGVCPEPTTCKKGEPTYNVFGKADHPVVCASWEDAQTYCQWVGARLPTEAEWEYAFRGEKRSIYPWGDIFDGSRLNYCDRSCIQSHADGTFDDGYPQTAPVGGYPTGISWSGVYNMSGNVSEWVSDWFGGYASLESSREGSEAISNPSGPPTGNEKIIKGCSWFYHPTYCRGAARHSVDPDTRLDYLGFRCASNYPITSAHVPDNQIRKSGVISSTVEPVIPNPNEETGLSHSSPENANLGDIHIRSSDEMKLSCVPSGTFQMGRSESDPDVNPAESPQHEITLDSFWIDQTEVTNAQYKLCVESGVCEKSRYANNAVYNADDYPAVGVTWQNAADYCDWVGGRLPTEAEWEYAAKGVEGSRYPWGDVFDGDKLNYCDQHCIENWSDPAVDDGYKESAPVGSFPDGASWVGVLDMAGNVWEWVWDWYADYSTDSQINPTGPETGENKVIRGGAWASPSDGLVTTYRIEGGGDITPLTRHPNIGFRCVVPVCQDTETGVEMDSIAIPSGSPPTIDGIMSTGEWKDAFVDTFADGSELHLLQAGDYLFLGIRTITPEMIASNVFIHQDDQINILHSSAALGTAIYQKSEQNWAKIQDFTWRCRSTSSSESVQAERLEFLQEEGWLAANGLMGAPNEMEYQIKISHQDFHLSAVYIKSSYPYEKVPWPVDLEDDCIQPSQGGLPEEMQFSPEIWRRLDLVKLGD